MTKVETDLFVRALALGGVLGMALQVIDSEVNDPKVATSRIVAAPNLATTEILSTIMEIPVETFQAILTGSLMRESLVPRPVKHTVEQRRRMLAKIYMNFSQSLSATPESEPSTAPSGSIPDESYKIVDMLSSRLTEDEELEYLVKWARSPTGVEYEDSWQPAENIDDPQDIVKFHRKYPEAMRYGVNQVDHSRLMPIEDREHIIYAQWFLDLTGDTFYFESPSTETLLLLLEKMRYYCRDFLPNHPEFARHRQWIEDVDNPPRSEGVTKGQWTRQKNRDGHKRFLCSGGEVPVLVEQRVENLENLLFPALEADLLSVTADERHMPHPRPWSEIGYTGRPKSRGKEHANHSGTGHGNALLECIAIKEFKDRRFRFHYQPIAYCRSAHQASFMESFFHRACQSYYWLGGFNSLPAGISVRLGDQMTIDNTFRAYDNINLAAWDANLKDSAEKVERFEELEKVRRLVESAMAGLEIKDSVRERYEKVRRELEEKMIARAKLLEQAVGIEVEAGQDMQLTKEQIKETRMELGLLERLAAATRKVRDAME